MYRLRDEYMDKFYDKNYNALMCMRFSYEGYLYDPMLNSFCNKERVFEIDRYGTTDCYLFYEEKRNFHEIEYENSIFDRLANNDLDDINNIGISHMNSFHIIISYFNNMYLQIMQLLQINYFL